ncbi:MAG TPA: ATPase, partial [Pseudonocardiaceae bacterium]|nr:ATPase [Pseudonocardiaceae bacterium]
TDANGRHRYDAVVLDAPPTGRIVKFLDVTRAMVDLAKVGPIRGQSEGVAKLLHSGDTAVHLVTLLEEMPVRETLDAVADLDAADLRPGAVLVNRIRPARLPEDTVEAAAAGLLDQAEIGADLKQAGLALTENTLGDLVTETGEHATRVRAELRSRAHLAEADLPSLDLPELTDGVDVAGLYELAEAMIEQGVR